MVGSSSSIFPWRPPSLFSRLCPGHWVVFLALSSACCLVTVRRVFTVPCGLVWCFSYLPCGPYARPLFGPLLFHRFFPRVSSVCTLLASRLLCSLASWLVLSYSFPVLVELRLPPTRVSLFGLLVLPWGSSWVHPPPLPSWLAPCVYFLGGFPGPPYFTGFLSYSSGLPVRRCPACVSLELFSGPLVLLAAVVPGSLIPLRCLTFRRLVSVPVCPRGSCGLAAFVLRTLRWCSAVSLLFVGLLWVLIRPVLFLFSFSFVCSSGRCSPSFPPFSPSGLLSARPLVLSPCPLGFSLLLVVCSCLLSPVGRLVLHGLRGFGVTPWSGVLFPGLSLFCAFGLYLFGSLPSFLSCSSGILRPGGCSFPWVSSSTTGVLAHSSGDGFPEVVCSVVCLQSSSPLRCRGSVFFLRLRFVRHLSPSAVFFSAFAMGSPWSGSSVGYGFSHSIGTKA